MKINLIYKEVEPDEYDLVGAWDEYAIENYYEGYNADVEQHQNEGVPVRILQIEVSDKVIADLFKIPNAPIKVIGPIDPPADE